MIGLRHVGFAAFACALAVGGCDCGGDPPGGSDDGGSGEGEGEGEGDAGDPSAPAAVILSPADGDTFSRGETITFSCSATDQSGGAIANGSIVWTTDVDGQIGIGATVQTALSAAGPRVVTCAATDTDGNVGRATVGIDVLANQVPDVVITAPADDAFVKTGATVSFVGGATDAEDGAIGNAELRWLDGTDPLGVGGIVSTAFAVPGDHVVTLLATDSSGGVGAASVTLHVVDNLPPVCSITSPDANDAIVVGASVQFRSNCTDPDGTGAIPNASYSWGSDVQGPLGVGQNVTTALVTSGLHTIAVCALDTVLATIEGCATVQVTVAPNQAPTTPVVTPASGSTFAACTPIALSCAATDPEGQNVTYTWQDSIEGAIGTGANLSWTPDVGGAHTVTCTAQDPAGATSSASTSLTTTGLTVTITAPQDGDTVLPGDTITFTGGGCSATLGALTGTQLSWSSDRDGALGTGPTFSRTLSTGPHVITLVGNDGTATAQDVVTMWVNTPPVVAITAPAGGTTVNVGDAVSFTGTATDAEDDPDPTPQWIDSAAGPLGAGTSTSSSTLALGKHVVTMAATDLAGETSTASVTITIVDPAGPLLTERIAAGVPIRDVAYDAATDTLWVIGEGDGLLRVDPETFVVLNTYPDIDGEVPLSVAILNGGALAVGTENGVAMSCAPADPSICTRTLMGTLDGNIGDRVQAIAQLPDGRTLLGTDTCWLFSDWTDDKHQAYCDGDGGGDGMDGDNVREIVVDAVRGFAWIIAEGRASLLLPAGAPEVEDRDAQTFRRYDGDAGLPSDVVRGVAIAPSGDVWFATDGGLARLVGLRVAESVTTFRTTNGMPSNDVRAVAVDAVSIGGALHEVAWAATSGGLGRVDGSLPSVVSITTADGLATNDLRSIVVGGAHEKLVGTGDGVLIYRGL